MRRHRYRKHDVLQLTEQAAEWLYELRSGDSGTHEAYLEWLLESPRHVEAFLRVSTVDASLSRLDPAHALEIIREPHIAEESNVTPLSPDSSAFHLRSRVESVGVRGRLRSWLIAACVVVVGLASGAWFLRQEEVKEWKHYVAGADAERVFQLEDGSLLHVSPSSRVDVRYSAKEREVVLQSGDALFRVHQESSRPFRVRSGTTVVDAVGTRFHVIREAQGSVVSVIDGRVRVAGRPAVFLSAGDEVYVGENGEVTTRSQADLAKLSTWRPKRLVFVNRTLGSMVTELNLYSLLPAEIRVDGAKARERRYAAVTFDADDPESFLAVLTQDPTLLVRRQTGEIVIRAR
jgi:transmembrane sensor